MPRLPADTALQAPLADDRCFGCGPANDAGLKLRFEAHPDGGVTASFQPAPEHQGWEGVMHGGLVALLLDEAMAWAAAAKTVKYFTGRMEVKYRRPVLVSSPLRLRGWLKRDRGRVLEMQAEVRDQEGQILAESSALFVRDRSS